MARRGQLPVHAGALQEVQTTIVLPVATESGRSHVRLPLDSFVGHAGLRAAVVARLETTEPLREVGVDGARFDQRKKTGRSAELAFAADRPVEIWWAFELAPLLARAQAVRLDRRQEPNPEATPLYLARYAEYQRILKAMQGPWDHLSQLHQ